MICELWTDLFCRLIVIEDGTVPVDQIFVFLTASGLTWQIRRNGLTYYFSLVSI